MSDIDKELDEILSDIVWASTDDHQAIDTKAAEVAIDEAKEKLTAWHKAQALKDIEEAYKKGYIEGQVDKFGYKI